MGNTNGHGIILANYIWFLSLFIKCIYLILEGILDRWSDRTNHIDYGIHERGFTAQLILKSLLQIVLPFIPWFCIKYVYFPSFGLLMGSIYGMLGPFAYFYSLLRPRGEFSLSISCVDEYSTSSSAYRQKGLFYTPSLAWHLNNSYSIWNSIADSVLYCAITRARYDHSFGWICGSFDDFVCLH